jgi:hypothetical protein
LPPAFSIASPASLASPFADETTPCFATTRLSSSAGDAGDAACGAPTEAKRTGLSTEVLADAVAEVAGSEAPVVDTVVVADGALVANAIAVASTHDLRTGAWRKTGRRRIISGMTLVKGSGFVPRMIPDAGDLASGEFPNDFQVPNRRAT